MYPEVGQILSSNGKKLGMAIILLFAVVLISKLIMRKLSLQLSFFTFNKGINKSYALRA